MTHSLHRRGSTLSLKDDFVFIAFTATANRAAMRPALGKIAEKVFEIGPANIGSLHTHTSIPLGLDRQQFVKEITGSNGVLCTFSDRERIKSLLAWLKEEDFGVSITVSGMLSDVVQMAQELDLKPHTVNLSMGILGQTGSLPTEEVLELTTMCGHALVSANLVQKGLQDVASGAKSARQVALVLGKPCPCGIFNLDRAEALLRASADRHLHAANGEISLSCGAAQPQN